MDTKRLLSRVAKLIDRTSDKIEALETLPEKGLIAEVGGLLERYTDLLRAINDQGGTGKGGQQTLEEILLHGRRGSYESLLED
jgi:hypothetical protein